MSRGLFDKLRVIELSSVLAGPSVGMFFAELGAEVIKIENALTNGDVTRKWKLPSEDSDKADSAYFNSVNHSKTHLFLDLNNQEDLKQTKKLINAADVLISNFKKGSAEKFNLHFEAIKALNPSIIHVNLIGFEQSSKAAYDVVLQAETAWLSMTGTSQEKAKIPVAMIDLMAAHQMKEAALIGLLERAESGKGSSFEISLEKSALSSLANLASNYLNENKVTQPNGTLHPNIAPYGELVKTKDNVEFALAIGSDKQFIDLLEILSLNELLEDKRFASNKHRLNNRSVLHSLLKKAFSKQLSEEVEDICSRKKIPLGRVKTIDEVLESPVAKEMRLKNNNGSTTLSGIAFKRLA